MKTKATLTPISDDVLILDISFELDDNKVSYIDFSLVDDITNTTVVEMKHFLVEGKSNCKLPVESKEKNKFTLSCTGGEEQSTIEVEYTKDVYQFNKDLPRSGGFSVRPSSNPNLIRTLNVNVSGRGLKDPLPEKLDGVVITYSDGSIETFEVKGGESPVSAYISKEFKYDDNLDFTVEFGTGRLEEVCMERSGDKEYDSTEKWGDYDCVYLNAESLFRLIACISNPTIDSFNIQSIGYLVLDFDNKPLIIPDNYLQKFTKHFPTVKQFCSSPKEYLYKEGYNASSGYTYNPSTLYVYLNNRFTLPADFFKQFGTLMCTEYMQIIFKCKTGKEQIPETLFDYVNTDVIDGTEYPSPLHLAYIPNIQVEYIWPANPDFTQLKRSDKLWQSMKEKFGSLGWGSPGDTIDPTSNTNQGSLFFCGLDKIPDIFDSISLMSAANLLIEGTFEYIPDIFKGTKATKQSGSFKTTRHTDVYGSSSSYPDSYPLPTQVEYHTDATPIRIHRMFEENHNLKTIDMDMLEGINIGVHNRLSSGHLENHPNIFRNCTALEGTVKDYVDNWYKKGTGYVKNVSILGGCTNLSDYSTVESSYASYIAEYEDED